MKFNMADYWDLCGPGEAYTVDWLNEEKIVYGRDRMYWTSEYGGCSRTDNYNVAADGTETWIAGWYVRNDPVRGILEIADLGPKITAFDKALLWWSPFKRMTYVVGKEIPWGAVEEIGSTKTWDILISPLPPTSAFLPPVPGGWWCRGQQIVQYQEHFDTYTDAIGRVHADVIKMQMWQPWAKNDPNDKSNTGCIYYLAKGIGRVAVDWVVYDRNLDPTTTYAGNSAVYSGSRILAA